MPWIAALLDPKTKPQDIFGKLTGERAEELLRRIRIEIHPDRQTTSELREKAIEASQRLAQLYDKLTSPEAGISVKSPTATYTVRGLKASGDLTDVYECDGHFLLKVARASEDNDLLKAEWETIKALRDLCADGHHIKYLPVPRETFVIAEPAAKRNIIRDAPPTPRPSILSARRAVNVFLEDRDVTSLEAIRQTYSGSAYGGVPAIHVAWMINRVLEILGYVHARKYVHGGILPPHILIEDASHGAVLCDFTQAVKIGEPLKLISEPYERWYPPEVLKKEPVTPGLDLYMLAKTVIFVLGGFPISNEFPVSTPTELRAFLKVCLYEAPRMRPASAWNFQDDFQKMLLRVYGTPKFRNFSSADPKQTVVTL